MWILQLSVICRQIKSNLEVIVRVQMTIGRHCFQLKLLRLEKASERYIQERVSTLK
jgi:hypothetical protein